MADGSVREKDPNDIELPIGKRTKFYRFLEILPGALSYSMIIALFVLSLISPTLGAIYLLIIIVITLVKAVGVAVRTYQGYQVVKAAMKVDWHKRVEDLKAPHEKFEELRGEEVKPEVGFIGIRKKQGQRRGIGNEYGFSEHIENLREISVAPSEYPKPEKIYHAVIMVAYNEGLETLEPSVEAVLNNTFDSKHVIFVLGYEERGGEEIEQSAIALQKKYKHEFYDFLIVKHPDGLKNEIKGKGPNLCYAAEELKVFVEKKHIPFENVIITSLDSDNRMSEKYLDYVTYEFVTHEDRQKLSYQPVALFTNNIWDASAPMRVIAVSNSFFNVINTMRPHLVRNFASHSQPMTALVAMNFWSKKTIVEDGHQYWRSLFFFKGDYNVLSVKVPIYQDAVLEETFWKTAKAQFVQLRRWDYGASDVAYVGVRMCDKKRRRMPLVSLFPKFWRLLDGHVTLAAMSPIVAFGGWVPSLMNPESRLVVAHNLPNTVSVVQMFASIGLFVMILLSLKMLPPRPARYKKSRKIFMVLQWILMPITAIVYQSAAAFYAQTRLMFGKYMENFDVTRKVVKK
ncbi:hypothetical protein IJ765_01865 [Candidatus Saccharibacteria bacterium]|nr:hypothetical protein [Candidatus Saccharibacteria bacterium]